MSNEFHKIKLLLILDVIICLLLALGVYQLTIKTSLPFNISSLDDQLIIESSYQPNNKNLDGDTVTSIMGYKINSSEALELLIDRKNIADTIQVVINNYDKILDVELIPHYNNSSIIVNVTSAALFLIFGLFVAIKKPELEYAKVFHWCCVCIACIILLSWGGHGNISDWLSFVGRTGFHAAYALVPALFIHFTLVFPSEKINQKRNALLFIYSFSSFLVLAVSVKYYPVLFNYTPLSALNYIFVLDLIRAFNVVAILVSVTIFIHTYKNSKDISEQKKLMWLLLGFVVGPVLYALLWLLPHWVLGEKLIPEAAIIVLMLAVPITFSIAIIKYQLMDIQLIINRGAVYSIVIGIFLVVYFTMLALIASLFSLSNSSAYSILIIISIALLFQPLKVKVQKYVDKKFFRVHYDFRLALKSFLKEINEANSINRLADVIVQRTDGLIPLSKIGFFVLTQRENYIKLISHNSFDLLVGRSIKFQKEKLKTDLPLPVAMPNSVEPGVKVELADVNVFKRWGMSIIFPIKSSSGVLYGFIVLGNKKSDTRFNAEDVDLLNNVAAAAAATIERIKLQEEVIREHLETERLEELNKMKSYFVSSVSHDLKTPLTSIKVFTDLLKSGVKKEDDKSNEYLEIIDGESDRLTRLINNVLNYSKIEKGIKEYKFEKVELIEVLNHVHNCMRYLLKMNGFAIKISLPKKPQYVYADKDSIIEAVINLISNSIKYSKNQKVISIALKDCENYKWIIVEDKGIGISSDMQAKIFEPFYQADNREKQYADGAGLGLSIVKHIMNAHKGAIEVESELGKGSKFILKFPSEKFNE